MKVKGAPYEVIFCINIYTSACYCFSCWSVHIPQAFLFSRYRAELFGSLHLVWHQLEAQQNGSVIAIYSFWKSGVKRNEVKDVLQLSCPVAKRSLHRGHFQELWDEGTECWCSHHDPMWRWICAAVQCTYALVDTFCIYFGCISYFLLLFPLLLSHVIIKIFLSKFLIASWSTDFISYPSIVRPFLDWISTLCGCLWSSYYWECHSRSCPLAFVALRCRLSIQAFIFISFVPVRLYFVLKHLSSSPLCVPWGPLWLYFWSWTDVRHLCFRKIRDVLHDSYHPRWRPCCHAFILIIARLVQSLAISAPLLFSQWHFVAGWYYLLHYSLMSYKSD